MFAGKDNKWPATLEFIAKEDSLSSLALMHVVQIRNEVACTWVEAFMDTHTNKPVHITTSSPSPP